MVLIDMQFKFHSDDKKQEILESKHFNISLSVPLNEFFFVAEVLKSMIKIFREYF